MLCKEMLYFYIALINLLETQSVIEMMKSKIVRDAQEVCRYVTQSNKSSCHYTELRNNIGLSETELNLALGWLLRNDEITFDRRTQMIYFTFVSFF